MSGGRDIERVCYAGWLPPRKLGVPAEKEKEGWEADRGTGREACGLGSGVIMDFCYGQGKKETDED